MKKLSLINYILLGSLILNAFLAGYIVSRMVKPDRPPQMPPFQQRMETAIDQVSPQYRDEISELLFDNQTRVRDSIIKMRQSFERITPILTASKFDVEAIKAIQSNLEAEDIETRAGLIFVMIDIAKILPDEERIKFFEEFSFERPGRKGRPPNLERPFNRQRPN